MLSFEEKNLTLKACWNFEAKLVIKRLRMVTEE